MSPAIVVTVIELQPTQAITVAPDGTRFTIPLSMIVGKPVLNQPLFVHIAAPGSEANAQHPIAQVVIEHLLAPSS